MCGIYAVCLSITNSTIRSLKFPLRILNQSDVKQFHQEIRQWRKGVHVTSIRIHDLSSLKINSDDAAIRRFKVALNPRAPDVDTVSIKDSYTCYQDPGFRDGFTFTLLLD